MLVFRNILITLGLLIVSMMVGVALENLLGGGKDYHGAIKGMQGLLLFSTALWAAISSNRLEFRRYQTALSYHPVTIFIVSLAFWIVVFPWFLTVRYKVKNGLVAVKPEFRDKVPPYPGFSATPPTPPMRPQIPLPAVVPPPLPLRPVVPPPLPTPPPLPGASSAAKATMATQPAALDQLEKLAGLKDRGILTEEEFTAEKRKLLGL